MITVRDLKVLIDTALDNKLVSLDSEVRYVDRDRKDCSFEAQCQHVQPGFKNGVPIDRRFGDGTFHLAQESTLSDASKQLLIDLDW